VVLLLVFISHASWGTAADLAKKAAALPIPFAAHQYYAKKPLDFHLEAFYKK